ncbi:MAG: 4Fe-4S dicluster domain-containing protein [Bacteroidetes bacterium]|nr:4Fe-4S dicluster domain-containing protein [Bacteroidota bacterium]
MAQLAMVIDLRKCAGCGACGIACKMENNTPDRRGGQTFNWADFFVETGGSFPNVEFTFFPVLCNHCSDAPCVTMCPVNPKALSKTPEGITIKDDSRCIGCRICQSACPYSARDVDTDEVQYSVISYNEASAPTHPFWEDTSVLISGCTSSGKDVSTKAGVTPPNMNAYEGTPYDTVRRPNVVEKCILCHHRIKEGDRPWCVQSCPSGARVVGDLDDPSSEVSRLLSQHQAKRLKNNHGELLAPGDPGVRPNVYYINEFMTTK